MWIGRFDAVSMPIVPNAVYLFSTIPIEIPMALFKELENAILAFLYLIFVQEYVFI